MIRGLFSPRSWSIAGRLTALYTALIFVMLVLAMLFLFWSLKTNLEKEDHDSLADEITVLRLILKEPRGNRITLSQEVQWEQATGRYGQFYKRVLSPGGRVIMQTAHMQAFLPVDAFPPPPALLRSPPAHRYLRAGHGRVYLLMAARALVGRGPRSVDLQAALDVSREEAFIASYREKLLLVLVCGILLSAAAGYAVARRGLRPLQRITGAVERITASRLHARMEPARWPRELRALARAFNDMLDRLGDSFTRLAQFSADLAHELRTPVNNLMGEAEVALNKARTADEYRQVLESSLEEYARLARTIDSLLFLARADNAELRLRLSRFDARRELDAVIEYHDAVAQEQGVEMICRGHAALDADPTLFRRAVSNLLSNALQYTPRGGRIEVDLVVRSNRVAVSVRDSGCGIEGRHLPYLFQRFYRADPARSNHPDGAGLGLAIVKSIMDLHGGEIRIESAVGTGTAVALEFPQANPLPA
ncbi:MAG: heavy metal sensor histidine kinase [Gammaproteobacteria bacterium]|nr:heavy metal sensor histidine kinase [Gammaproteobacteria bacterium]